MLAHLALRAFYPGKPPFALLHIDSTWEFQSLLDFRDAFARRHGFRPGEMPTLPSFRFRTLGCWPVTGAIASEAATLAAVVQETLTAGASERQGRISDQDSGGSLEQQKRQRYF